MKKLAVALGAMVVGILGSGLAAQAQYGANEFGVTAKPTVVAPGGTVTVTVEGCVPGEPVKTTLVAESDDAICEGGSALGTPAASGTAVMTVSAPMEVGPYTGTASAPESGNSGQYTIRVVAQSGSSSPVPARSLPQTGSSGMDTTIGVAAGLFVVGASLLVVTQLRRRRTTIA
jgi:LPXTG-motif cell wall-anchored protein